MCLERVPGALAPHLVPEKRKPFEVGHIALLGAIATAEEAWLFARTGPQVEAELDRDLRAIRLFWFHNGPPSEAESQGEALRERLLALHADDPPWIAELLRATPAVLGPWPLFELDPLPAWSRERVVLLGDAAHAMSPSAGQGASLAIEDALVLARSLAAEPDRASALASYERARRPRVERIAKVARRSSNGKAPSSAFAETVRDLVLPFFLRLGGAQQERAYDYRVDAA